MKNVIGTIFSVIVLGASVFYSGFITGIKSVNYDYDTTNVVYDTVFVNNIDTSNYHHSITPDIDYSEIDTIVAVIDSVANDTTVIDTVIQKPKSVMFDKEFDSPITIKGFKTEYLIAENELSIDFIPAKTPVITQTVIKTVNNPCERKFYETPLFGYVAGVLTAVIIVQAVRK